MQNSADTTLARAQPLPKTRRFKTLRVLFALVLRELSASDSRASLGFLWLIIEPVAAMVLLTVIMSLLTRTPPLGTNFPLFYVTGLLPFRCIRRSAPNALPPCAFPSRCWVFRR